jgi:hypothetical protein
MVRTVSAFFESYRSAFERQDAAAVADHFAYPSHVTSDAGDIVLIPVGNREEWVTQIERLLAMYGVVGVATARAQNVQAAELSPRLIQAAVHWSLFDKAGGVLYKFEATYTLVALEGGLRIAAISHNEVPRYRECLARLQAQGS